MLSAEGFRSRQSVDGLDPICLSLTVVAVDNVKPWSPKYLAAEISEVVRRNRLKQHATILTQRYR